MKNMYAWLPLIILAAWLILQLWVLPKMGIST